MFRRPMLMYVYHPINCYHSSIHSSSTSGKTKAKAKNGNSQIPDKQERTFKVCTLTLSHSEDAEWSWYQMVDDREASWSCPLRVTLPSLAWVSARNMSSKSWSARTGTSTPWLGLVSILLRRLAQAGTRSPDSASLYCEDTVSV